MNTLDIFTASEHDSGAALFSERVRANQRTLVSKYAMQLDSTAIGVCHLWLIIVPTRAIRRDYWIGEASSQTVAY